MPPPESGLKALGEIEIEVKTGKFKIDPNFGLHLTIEAMVVKKLGDDGYFMHTARSRNDQVATAELLYLRDKSLAFLERLVVLENSLLKLSSEHILTVMSGYTHMQPAKPTTFGQWCLLYFDMLFKAIDTFIYMYKKYDLCPLGSVESYGTTWKIDREMTASLLGFEKPWEVPLEAISSRGFVQLSLMIALREVGIALGKCASDLLLFVSYEFGFVDLGKTSATQMDKVTGSSIMPQKKNPDVLELIRSISSQLIGLETTIASILTNLPLGYNRDTREVKEYIEMGFDKCEAAVFTMTEVFETLTVNKKKMLESVKANFCLSADLADRIAQTSGLPYRKIYQVVGSAVKEKISEGAKFTDMTIQDIKKQAKAIGLNLNFSEVQYEQMIDPLSIVKGRTHIGGSSPGIMKKMIAVRKKELSTIKKWIVNQRIKIKKVSIALDNLARLLYTNLVKKPIGYYLIPNHKICPYYM